MSYELTFANYVNLLKLKQAIPEDEFAQGCVEIYGKDGNTTEPLTLHAKILAGSSIMGSRNCSLLNSRNNKFLKQQFKNYYNASTPAKTFDYGSQYNKIIEETELSMKTLSPSTIRLFAALGRNMSILIGESIRINESHLNVDTYLTKTLPETPMPIIYNDGVPDERDENFLDVPKKYDPIKNVKRLITVSNGYTKKANPNKMIYRIASILEDGPSIDNLDLKYLNKKIA